jgi:hypothetical protein
MCSFGSLNPSHITNTTFRGIHPLYNNTHGGAFFVNTLFNNSILIERCIFTLCEAYRGGALYLISSSPYINITLSRFEKNSASDYGNDIYTSNSSCFSPNTISNTCTTTPSQSVYCYSGYKSIIPISCDMSKIVLFFNMIKCCFC